MNTKIAAPTYTEVSLTEMEKFLKNAFRGYRPKKVVIRGETCFDMTIGKHVGVRVMTSIGQHQEIGAGVGQDAIRVGLISLKDRGPLKGGKMPIVKRTENWRDSLKDRIEDCVDTYEAEEESLEEWAEWRGKKPNHAQPEPDHSHHHEPVVPTPAAPAAPVKQYDPDRMQGKITDSQMSYLRILMRGMTQEKWQNLGANKITGLEEWPRSPAAMHSVSKGQASRLIDALKNAPKYASEPSDQDVWKA